MHANFFEVMGVILPVCMMLAVGEHPLTRTARNRTLLFGSVGGLLGIFLPVLGYLCAAAIGYIFYKER